MRSRPELAGPRSTDWDRCATQVESFELSIELGEAGQRIAVRLGLGFAEFDAAVAKDVAEWPTGRCRRHGSGRPPLSREGPRNGRPPGGWGYPVASCPTSA